LQEAGFLLPADATLHDMLLKEDPPLMLWHAHRAILVNTSPLDRHHAPRRHSLTL
jgi:hypothetical protein